MDGFLIFVFVIAVFVIICRVLDQTGASSDELPGIARAYEDIQKLPEKERGVVENYINELIWIVKNNVRFLPKNVFEMEYTKKAINAFLWYYTAEVFFKRDKLNQGFILLTIIIDKLDKEGIIKSKDFDPRIFNDHRFDTMPAMISIFSSQPAKNNTLILVFIERYMEDLTGKKVRYMYGNTNNTEEKKTVSINDIELSQENDLDIVDRPDRTEEYWRLREEVSNFLQKRFKKYDGFRWIRIEPMSPKFDDMSFAYKNKIFSVLMDIKYSDNDKLSKREKDRFIKECSSNNLVPCIFPISDKKSLSFFSDEHWNLYDIRKNEIINPLTVANDEKIMMSNYEFNNMAVRIVKDYIRKENMHFESYCDIVGIFPQIWFKDENNEMSWIYVNYSTTTRFDDVSKELDKLIKGLPQYNGYLAQVGLMCIEQEGPYRGAGFYIKFNGIEKVYAAHKDIGHGYGINVKVQ